MNNTSNLSYPSNVKSLETIRQCETVKEYRTRNVNLELVRFLAFLMVFLGHLLGSEIIKPSMGKSLFFFVYGHEAVIAFFLLSGFVNRIAIDRKPTSGRSLLRSRMVRLIPLYYLIVILCFFIQWILDKTPPTTQLIGHLTCLTNLQGDLFRPVDINGPLWSMAFECWFYVFFAFSLLFNRHTGLMVWSCLSAIALIFSVVPMDSSLLNWSTKLFGYSSVWLLGFFAKDIAQYVFVNIWTVVLLLGTIPVASNLEIPKANPLIFFLEALLILPLFLILSQSNAVNRSIASHRYMSFLTTFLGTTVVGFLLILLVRSGQPMRRTGPLALAPFAIATISVLMAKFVNQLTEKWSSEITALGRGTYAAYLVHVPVIYLCTISELSPLTLVTTVIVVTTLLTIVLEWGFQPIVYRLLNR